MRSPNSATRSAVNSAKHRRRAHAGGVAIGFWAYLKVGAPLSILSILFGVWWL
jgi:hypothetical protein